MTEAAGDQTRQRPPGRYAFTGVSHVFGVAAGDLLVRVAEPQNLLDLAGGLQGDGGPCVETGLVPVHLAQGEDLGAGEAARLLGSGTADLTAFVSMAPRGEQFARELFTYKNLNLRPEDRQRKTVGLAAVLWKWLGIHEACLVTRLQAGFDLITSVPSTSGRPSHPLRTVVAGVVSDSGKRYADLLALARDDLGQRVKAADRFRAIRALGGARVLVIDDTWTTGAHAQSASAALKAAGVGSHRA
jgi:hypothetical protein